MDIITILSSPEGMMSLLTLTLMEVILGIDNLVFLSIVSGRLPESQQAKARQIGLILALGFRIVLLLGISWLVGLDKYELFHLPFIEHGITVKNLILFVGGLFLLYKATNEIHHKLEGEEEEQSAQGGASVTFSNVIVQILLLDMVFSVDSILTAVGLVEHVGIMITAVVISMIVMLIFVNTIADFIQRHPTVKMLALSFLMLIGVMLLAEGLHFEIPKGYIYFAMFFSLAVEFLNMQLRKTKKPPVNLRKKMTDTKS